MVKRDTILKKIDVFCIGNALMDILLHVDNAFVKQLGIPKGSFKLVDEQELTKLESAIENKAAISERFMMPGGSASNVAAGVVTLGGTAMFCGKIGNDPYGRIYRDRTLQHGVQDALVPAAGRTGIALTFITPDAQRTFAVYLGVSTGLAHHELAEDAISKSSYFHLESFLLDEPCTREMMLQAMEYAKKHKVPISLDLGDYRLVRRHRDVLDSVMRHYIDIVFANEEEAAAFTGKEPKNAVRDFVRLCPTVVVKIGAAGSHVYHNGKLVDVEGVKAKAIDTTGAGDMYAAGFLYGLAREYDFHHSAKIGSYAAARIVEVVGARMEASLAEDIQNLK